MKTYHIVKQSGDNKAWLLFITDNSTHKKENILYSFQAKNYIEACSMFPQFIRKEV